MTSRGGLIHSWWSGLAGTLTIGTILASSHVAVAQIIPDTTLGAESSTVTRDVLIRGISSDRIDGGAIRGANLFHSFEQFNVDAFRGAYFTNPAGIQNILSRVTGSDPSNILGRLGVLGNANLFLINPNGILFGANASLDVNGSFVATTANAIQFGAQGFFSANNPEAPSSLLTVNPSAFLFNQIPTGNIVNNSVAPIAPESDFLVGLRVANGENITLLGGSVNIDGGQLSAFGGRVEIGAVAGTGTVGLNADGSLDFPTNLQRADVSFTNGARVAVSLNNGGDIGITGQNIALSDNSQLIAGIASGFGSLDSQAGNIVLDAEAIRIARSTIFNAVSENGIGNSGDIRIRTSSISLTNGAQLDTSVFGRGNAGDIIVNARDTVSLYGTTSTPLGELGSVIFAEVLDDAEGNGGDIVINTGLLSVTNGAAIIARTRGRGNAGNITVRASDAVSFDGTSGAGSSNASSGVVEGAVGRGGNIEITTGSLSFTNGARLNASTFGRGSAGNVIINTGSLTVTNGAELNASTFGQGSAGNVIINASDRVVFNDSAALSLVGQNAEGMGGNIEITTGSLAITNGTALTAGTSGKGSSGSVIINARDHVALDRSGIYSSVEESAVGSGGNIEITTGSLTATNGSQLYSNTSGQGKAGNIIITARDHIFSDAESLFISSIEQGGVGRSGNITITTDTLSLTNGAELLTRTRRGQGNAGSIFITARDAVLFAGTGTSGVSSGAFSGVGENAVGRGGNIEITTGSLSVVDGAQLGAPTEAQGNAGNVIIQARDRVLFEGTTADGQFATAVFSSVEKGGRGRGGNVEITTGLLTVKGGAQLTTATEEQGDAGNIIIRARDRVVFDGESPTGRFATTASSSVQSGATGTGGNVEIATGSLAVTNGAQLIAVTRGRGDAGDVIIRASNRVLFDGVSEIGELSSGASSDVIEGAVGRGGNIDISADSLLLTNGGFLSADTSGQGNAGNVIIRANGAVSLEGVSTNGRFPSISTLTEGQGSGGTITVSTPLFRIADGAAVDARTASSYRGGDITVNADTVEVVNGGQVITTTQSDGQAGNITLNAERISLSGRNPASEEQLDSISIARREGNGESGLFASTPSNSTGNGGTITLRTNSLSLTDRAQISASSSGTGQAGGVAIAAKEALTLTNSDITTAAEQASGGAISITAGAIRLYGDSDIRTNVESGSNDGGNITLLANSILAFDDSDILAFAQDGRGGNVILSTPAFFGENYQPAAFGINPNILDGNERVDINASGAVNGAIALPDNSFIQNSLLELPEKTVDAERLIANSCIARTQQGSSFVITGAGGLPKRPGDASISPYPTGEVRSVTSDNSSSSGSDRPWQVGEPIIEPQGVYQLPDGQLVLSRECSE